MDPRFNWRRGDLYGWWLLFFPLEQLGDALWLIGDRLHHASLFVYRFTTPLYQHIDPVGVAFRCQQLEQMLAIVEKDKEIE